MMKTIRMTYLLILLFMRPAINIYAQNDTIENPFSSLSLNGAHIVFTEVKIQPNIPVNIYLFNKDSTMNIVLLNDSNPSTNKLIITDEDYAFEAKNKFPNSQIILQPKLEAGLYYYVYETKGQKYIHKFFYLK